MAINFFFEDVENIKLAKNNTKNWIKGCIISYKKKVGNINYIFCSDDYFKDINVKYLNHDYYTDIITFDYSEKDTIHSDIYVSIDRVQDNAVEYKVDFIFELLRVLIHGILHLTGQKDESENDKIIMREKENKWLSLYSKSI